MRMFRYIVCLMAIIWSVILYGNSADKQTISFKENKGQISDQYFRPRPDILFAGQKADVNFYLRNNGISYQMNKVDEWTNEFKPGKLMNKNRNVLPSKGQIFRLDINWLNTNLDFKLIKEEQLPGFENYYTQVCPNGVLGVKSFKKLKYQNIYKGIDLVWYDAKGNLKYDYYIFPGFDYKQIKWEISGADTIFIDHKGNLIIQTPLGSIAEESPIAFQDSKKLKAKWQINKNVVSFTVAGIDPSKTLIIDPLVRLWGTYFGGNKVDWFYGSCTDNSGNLYVTGGTDSESNIATIGAHQVTYGGYAQNTNWFTGDAVLAKYDSVGNKIWCTYYGGDHGDFGSACAVNSNGNYVAMVGVTASTLAGVITTQGCHQSVWNDGQSPDKHDGFCALFDANGVRIWGTYYGGTGGDIIYDCCFDSSDNLFLCGGTSSSNSGNVIATNGAFQSVFGGKADAFLAKFNISGSRLWSTYYGANGTDYAESCVYDKAGYVYMVGTSSSSVNISTPGSHQPNYGGGIDPMTMGVFKQEGDAMIVKFDENGNRIWATYYGHGHNDWANDCALDSNNDLIVSGATTFGIPGIISTPGSFQSNYGGGIRDAFLLKLNSSGVRQWCTFFGGTGNEPANYCDVDANDDIYLCGNTSSSSSITTPCSYQPNYGGGSFDIYLAKFSNSGMRLWSTYYGSNSLEDYAHCRTDMNGHVYIVGETTGSGGGYFGSLNASQSIYGGGAYDGIIAKFNGCKAPENLTPPDKMIVCTGNTTTLQTNDNCGVRWYDQSGTYLNTGGQLIIGPEENQTYYVIDSTCGNSNSVAINVTVDTYPELTIVPSTTLVCQETEVKLKASGAMSYSWTPNDLLSCEDCSEPSLKPTETKEYCVTAKNLSCETNSCITIEVNIVSANNFSAPNAFTPNGDGQNDSFCLKGWKHCNESFSVIIFNRWGEKVFESEDPDFCWDGTLRGKPLSSDVYVYHIVARFNGDAVFNKKGNITLIR
jgi:gliding motility-associated-like protein